MGDQILVIKTEVAKEQEENMKKGKKVVAFWVLVMMVALGGCSSGKEADTNRENSRNADVAAGDESKGRKVDSKIEYILSEEKIQKDFLEGKYCETEEEAKEFAKMIIEADKLIASKTESGPTEASMMLGEYEAQYTERYGAIKASKLIDNVYFLQIRLDINAIFLELTPSSKIIHYFDVYSKDYNEEDIRFFTRCFQYAEEDFLNGCYDYAFAWLKCIPDISEKEEMYAVCLENILHPDEYASYTPNDAFKVVAVGDIKKKIGILEAEAIKEQEKYNQQLEYEREVKSQYHSVSMSEIISHNPLVVGFFGSYYWIEDTTYIDSYFITISGYVEETGEYRTYSVGQNQYTCAVCNSVQVPNDANNTLKVVEKINEIIELHKNSFSYEVLEMNDYQIESLTSYELDKSQLVVIENNYFCNDLVFEDSELLNYDGYFIYGNKEGVTKIRVSLRFNDDDENPEVCEPVSTITIKAGE